MGPLQPHFGHLAAQAVLTALELGVFRRLARGPATARSLARVAGANSRAMRMLLDALVGLEQIERQDDRYCLPAGTRRLLECPGVTADELFEAARTHLQYLLADWSRLTEVVRTGKPVDQLGHRAEGPAVFAVLVKRLFPRNYLQARQLVRALPARFRREPVRVLDVGAGSAAWSIPFAEANPRARVTAVDFAPVLDVARHFTRHCGVEGCYTFRAGNLRRVRLGREAYEVALLGHICHSEGEAGSRRLFRRVHQALAPRGILLVADMLADEGRQGRDEGAFALLFALNMLVHTRRGGTFTVAEYRSWAEEAGFRRFRRLDVGGPFPVLLFQK